MKKVLSLLLAILPMVAFVSCSKDEGANFTLSQNSVELPYKGEVELDITGVKADDCNFTSSDDFISEATSYKGKILIRGRHVGKAIIVVSCGGRNVELPVTVRPVENVIGLPIIDFGASPQSIKERETATYNTTYEDGKIDFYDDTLPFRVYHRYRFKDGKMYALMSEISIPRLVGIYRTFFIQVTNSLSERYEYLSVYTGKHQRIYLYTYKNKYYIGARDAGGNGGWYVYYSTSLEDVKVTLDVHPSISIG